MPSEISTSSEHSAQPAALVVPPSEMDCSCHHHHPHHAASHRKHCCDLRLDENDETNHHQPLLLELEEDLEAEVQAFVEAEEDILSDDDDDEATASVTDSSDSDNGDSLDGSLSSLEDDSGDCCSLYDDEQDIACLQEASQNLLGKKGVRFSTVEVREYAVTVGDHPCASDSCPLTLDWQYAKKSKRDINSFENSRYFMRRSYPQRLSPHERRRRIRETSRISKEELDDLEAEVAMNRLNLIMTGMYDTWGQVEVDQHIADTEGFWCGTNVIDSDTSV